MVCLDRLESSVAYSLSENSKFGHYVAAPLSSKRTSLLRICRDERIWRLWGDNISGKRITLEFISLTAFSGVEMVTLRDISLPTLRLYKGLGWYVTIL